MYSRAVRATASATRDADGPRADRTRPGVIALFVDGRAVFAPLPLRDGELALGRAALEGVKLLDESVSRHHAGVVFDGRRWSIRDHGSRNGVFVDGERVQGERVAAGLRFLRLGRTVFALSADLGAYAGGVTEHGAHMAGPSLRAAWEAIDRAASSSDTLHVVGETGTGKELAARRFHASGPHPRGPFVAVNCAAIPEGLAERLLFGAVKGAFTGASADATGYVQAADGGTLFLDEVAELDARVQATLLRVLEAREVLPLGATRPRPVTLRLCSATHTELRAAVGEDRFRADLYFRIGRPDVRLPPLRDRPEEIVHLLARAIAEAAPGLTPHATLVEACLLRPWPGNVRELLGEAKRAAGEARAHGRAVVLPEDLGASAGAAFTVAAERGAGRSPSVEEIEGALEHARGNVTAAARALGVHRNQLRRWIARSGIDPVRFGAGGGA